MESKTVWVECWVAGQPFWFPGHDLEHAKARAIKSFEGIAIHSEDIVIIKEYTPRRKIVTLRKHKRLRAKQLLLS